MNALTNYAWWNDRNGNQIKYWDGDYDLNKEGCACSKDNSCDRNVCNNFKPQKRFLKRFSRQTIKSTHGTIGLCNCDDVGLNNIDEGVLRKVS